MNFVRRNAVAISLIIAVVAIAFAIYFQRQGVSSAMALQEAYDKLTREYQSASEKLEKYNADQAIIENTLFTKVTLKGTANDPEALAFVYWNATTHEVFVSAQKLKPVSADKQFQLWAIVRGKTVPVGLFDLPATGLLKMKDIADASAFAITVEKRGGRDQPTLEALQVIGSVFIIPS